MIYFPRNSVQTTDFTPRTRFRGFFYGEIMDSAYYEQTNELTAQRQLSIGELAKILGCNRSLLRYYEEQFSLEIPRNSSNRRYYTPKELEKFRYILKLKDSGLSNPEIKSVLESERIERTEYEFLTVEPEKDRPAPPPERTEELRELYEIIASLRDEINELKSMGAVMEKSLLVEENNSLRQKLKEKTYELVSLREKSKPKKRFFQIGGRHE